MQPAETPFRLSGPLRNWPAIGPLVLGLAERALAFERLANIHRQAAQGRTPAEFAQRALASLQVRFEVDPAQVERIPASGPAVVVANHPYGGLEGLFLIALLLRRRLDTRLIVNELLQRIPEMNDVIIPVDAFGGSGGTHANATALRHALQHLKRDGLLVLFPAGTVSHLHLSAARVCDPPWSPVAARLVKMSGCPVVPIHFGGSNGAIFQTLGLLHPRVRTAMLSRELLNKRHRVIPVTIGRAIAPARIKAHRDDAALASYLRLSTYAIGSKSASRRRTAADYRAQIEPAVPHTLLEAEIDCLKDAQTLATSADMSVLFARAEQIPWTLREIGRLREIAFRAVGEGTGRSTDLDRYDQHYVHLIAWHHGQREVAGAYRVGHVDELVRRFGARGLYTRSLFSYGKAFLRGLGPALELGRSFVSPAHQKSFGTLLMLWRGIAEYVCRNPRYHVLFGPVSVSGEYRPDSHALLIDFLERHCYDDRLAQLIRARRPFRRTHSLAALNGDLTLLAGLDDLSSLLEEMEPDGKGVPILLRQYLKLGARLVGFNVDERFSNAIDGMIVVDLLRTDQRALHRYMGREQALAYLAHPRERAVADQEPSTCRASMRGGQT